MRSSSLWDRHDNVYVYVPNLIGYFRVVCVLCAFAVSSTSPGLCLLCYFVGFACDELDGRFARKFNQTSRLGAVLDMVTDRASTAGLLALLCKFSPGHASMWVLLLALDISSHWFQMYTSAACGEMTHKEVDSKNALVRMYYSQRLFMGFCCVSCEVLYLCTYAICQPKELAMTIPAPAAFVPVRNWLGGSPTDAPTDVILAALLLLALPGCAVKQVVNVFQLRFSMDRLVELELKQD